MTTQMQNITIDPVLTKMENQQKAHAKDYGLNPDVIQIQGDFNHMAPLTNNGGATGSWGRDSPSTKPPATGAGTAAAASPVLQNAAGRKAAETAGQLPGAPNPQTTQARPLTTPAGGFAAKGTQLSLDGNTYASDGTKWTLVKKGNLTGVIK
jgi:hypothetical protein